MKLFPITLLLLFTLINYTLSQFANGDIILSTSSSGASSLNDIGNADATAISSSSSINENIIEITNPYSTSSNTNSNFLSSNSPSNDIHSTNVNTPSYDCININWYPTNKQASDISVSSQGDVYVSGLDGLFYYYNFLSNTWSKLLSEESQLKNIIKVSVSYDNTPFVLTSSGDTYYNTCDGNWIKLAGCATDIAVGRGGEVFKLGCDLSGNGFSLYKLFCDKENEGNENMFYKKTQKCKNNYINRINNIYNTNSNKVIENRKCYWFKLNGSGVKIAVNLKGNPVLIDISGNILLYNNDEWLMVAKGVNARDISISNEGEIYYTNNEHSIYKITRLWESVKLCGKARGIGIGPFNQAFIIGKDYNVYTSSKSSCFN
jgi:hypothetical protein